MSCAYSGACAWIAAANSKALEMVSSSVTAALEKAAKRAARIAQADAGLGQEDPPKHPSKKKGEALEKAKESSRLVSMGLNG